MRYELRIEGVLVSSWPRPDLAERAANELLRREPDAEPEVFDTQTGRALAPAATDTLRAELAEQTGG